MELKLTRAMRGMKTLVIATALLTLAACGLTAPKSGPGFAELASPGIWDTDRQFAISLGPTILRFAASHIDDDPEVEALLRSLDGVRIRVYEIDGDSSKVADRMDLMQDDLRGDGWAPVMIVREGNERTHLMLKSSGGEVHGMTLLSSDGESEAVVINLIGDIQPEMFSDVMVALDIDEGGAQDVEVRSLAKNENQKSGNQDQGSPAPTRTHNGHLSGTSLARE